MRCTAVARCAERKLSSRRLIGCAVCFTFTPGKKCRQRGAAAFDRGGVGVGQLRLVPNFTAPGDAATAPGHAIA